jgi:ribosomal protein L24
MDKKFKIRKDDTVEIIAGKDKGKRGTIVRVITDKDRVIVSGANIVKKAMKAGSRRYRRDRSSYSCIQCYDRLQEMRTDTNRVQN